MAVISCVPVVVGEDALSDGLIVDSVRPLTDIDLPDELQRSSVEDGDFVLLAVAGKAAVAGGDGDAVHARRIGNGAHLFTRVGVEHLHLGGVRNVDAAGVAVNRNVVPSARAREWVAPGEFIARFAVQRSRACQECDAKCLGCRHGKSPNCPDASES